MTLLKLLGFLKMRIFLSHFDGFFGVFMSNMWLFDVIFDNFIPLLPRENGAPTFLQWSH